MKTTANLLTRIAACSAIALAANAAHADTYDFVLTGAYTAHWQLDSSPTPDGSIDGLGFAMFDISGDFPNTATGVVDVSFFHEDFSGGMAIDDFIGDETNMMTADGPQLYTGGEDAPTFKLGTFALTGSSDPTQTFTLTITNVTAVPEPETYAMLMAGLGVLGFVAARRRKV